MATAVEIPITREEQTNTEKAVRPSDTAVNPQSTEERIRIRAYELYERRGGESGDAESDWYQAETEIVTEAAGQDH